MARKKSLFYLCGFINVLLLNSIQAEDRSSLTFAIDDTGSMSDDIEAVKRSANAIFDTVVNSNASQIEDFILVTFNDPTYSHRITTTDRDDFKSALDSIYVDGGDDCPEMAMGGIELGLQKSKPGSLLYAFTDASAKDGAKHEAVKSLAHSKGIQVVIVLTGKCNSADDEVYYQVANETNGQVFNLHRRSEIDEVLKYVQTQINNRKENIATKAFTSGTHKFDFEVDSKMKELVVSVSGENPTLKITGPDSIEPPSEEIARTSTFVVVKVTEVKPGTYTAKVTSTSRNSVKVTAETTVHFRHGFSTFTPTSIADTVTRPIPGEPSYLSVKLQTDEPGDVILDKVQIMDLNHNVLEERTLELVDRKNQFYVSKTTVVPPNHMFRVAIRAHDAKSKNIITRISLTPIDVQKPVLADTKTPIVTLIGEMKINADYNETLVLKCKVSGYPKPKVIWQSSNGTILDSTLSLVETPYDYLSSLTIPRVISNNTYYCVARNDYGGDRKEIQVETIRKIYFNLMKRPKGGIIDVNNEARFECEVDASPLAIIGWFKDDRKVKEDHNVKISSNRSVLLIKHMQPRNEGKYYCEAIHETERHRYHFNVYVSGVEVPVIDKTIGELRITEGSDVIIPCKVINGKPKPTILWFYKDSSGYEHSLDEFKDKEDIFLSGVTGGTYRCEAHNDVGGDYHTIEVIFNYPPKIIVEGDTDKLARVDEKVYMDCDVEGEPAPTVKWFKYDTELVLTARYSRDYYSHGFSFDATEEDTGTYTCVVTNDFGTANKSIDLHIIRPVTITPPDESTLGVNVGDTLKLPCKVDGKPKPEVNWIFHSLDPKIAPKTMRPSGGDHKLLLKRIQVKNRGIYTCIASNVGGSMNIAYEVDVFAPPNIENVYPEKTFTAVSGDLVLRVLCKASGNPEPDITWTKDGVDKVPAGTEKYDIEEDGTLVIKNVDKLSAGRYICEARNRLGFDAEYYDVDVEGYPRPGHPTKTVRVQRGNSTTLTCDIPYRITDYVRWFKDGKLLPSTQEYHITNAQLSDAGTYACRVSNFEKSRTGTIEVNVGFEPRFTVYLSDEEEEIEFNDKVTAIMDCSAEGNPKPEVSWWHDGKQLPFDGMTYIFSMNVSNKGLYYCLLKNEFGYIRRKFNIVSEECWLDIQSDMKGNQPLLLTPDATWPTFKISEGHLKIPSRESMLLYCPSGFKNLRTTNVTASCERESFKVDGRSYKFSELQCSNEIVPVARRTRKKCLRNNPSSNIIKIGYGVGSKFLEVFEVCLDIKTRVPLYAKHGIHYSLANVEPKETKWHKNELIPNNIDEMYNCDLQINTISSVLGSWFHRDDKCCFSKRPLVNARDVTPGLSQIATYTAFNLVPQWSTCHNENWETIERKVRLLTRHTNEELLVWTGAANQLQISGHNININDKRSGGQPVPKYLWKVVQDPSTKASLAIIQLNIPDVTLVEAYRHLPCRDICHEISWMKSKSWRDVTKGYTFCCNVKEFERALGYRDVFDSGDGKVLYDIPHPTTRHKLRRPRHAVIDPKDEITEAIEAAGHLK